MNRRNYGEIIAFGKKKDKKQIIIEKFNVFTIILRFYSPSELEGVPKAGACVPQKWRLI